HVRGTQAQLEGPQPAQEIVKGPLRAHAHLLPVLLDAEAAAELQLVELAGRNLNGDRRAFLWLRIQLDPDRREHAQLIQPPLRGADLVGLVAVTLVPGDAVFDGVRRDVVVADHVDLAHFHERSRLALQLQLGDVLIAIDVSLRGNLGVGEAGRLEAQLELLFRGEEGLIIEPRAGFDRNATRNLVCLLPFDRFEPRKVDALDVGGLAFVYVKDDVDRSIPTVAQLVPNVRIEVTVVGIKRAYAIDIDIERRRIEPPLARERPPTGLLGGQAVFDIASIDVLHARKLDGMDPFAPVRGLLRATS